MERAASTFGYDLSRHQSSAGHVTYRLEVTMRPAPTHRHFDPETVGLGVWTQQHFRERLLLRHPAYRSGTYRACPGRISLCDRKNKCVVYFTYGGEFIVSSTLERTTCVLLSPAPLVEYAHGEGMQTRLAERSEVLLARRRAAWGHDPQEYDARLCQVDSLELYAAVLQALAEQVRTTPHSKRSAVDRRFARYLRTEMQLARQSPGWPNQAPALDDIL